jgi:hypothetical protein
LLRRSLTFAAVTFASACYAEPEAGHWRHSKVLFGLDHRALELLQVVRQVIERELPHAACHPALLSEDRPHGQPLIVSVDPALEYGPVRVQSTVCATAERQSARQVATAAFEGS